MNRPAAHQERSGGSRHRQLSVRHADRSGSHRQGGSGERFDLQVTQPLDAGENVDDRVEGSDLVEVDPLLRDPVDARLRLRDPLEHCHRALGHLPGKRRPLHDRPDLRDPAMRRLRFSLDDDAEPGELVLPPALDADARAGQTQPVHQGGEPFFAPTGVEERAHEHVSAQTGPELEMRALHGVCAAAAPASLEARATRAAAMPAPYPLSMLHTKTPGAQLLSIVRSAAMPPKLAPYPTEVGTAITVAATSPPTTEGSAPSIPATT